MTKSIVKKKVGSQSVDPEIGPRLRKLRIEHLQTNQKKLATLLGASPAIVSQWESGKYMPSPMALMAIGRLSISDKQWWFKKAGGYYADKEETLEAFKAEMRASGQSENPGEVDNQTPNKLRQSSLDRDLLGFVMAEVDRELALRKLDLSVGKKTELIAILYDICAETGRRDSSLIARILNVA